jgi:outer membrane protein assembly factor BamB
VPSLLPRAVVFASALALAGGALAASNPLAMRPCAAARGPLLDIYEIEAQLRLVERPLLEYAPRELSGPAIDAFTGDVYVGTRDGVLRSLTAGGVELWRTTLPAAPTSAPALTDDSIFVGVGDGRLHAFDRFSGETRWTAPMQAAVIERPVARGPFVFVGTDQDTVLALDAGTGEVKWTYRRTTPEGLTIRGGVGVALDGERLFAGFSDGVLVALGAADGRLLWEARLAGALARFPDVNATPLPRDGRVYAASFATGVFALDAETGREIWRADAPGATGLLLDGDLLFVAGAGTARALRALDGAVAWTVNTGDVATGLPVIANGKVAFPSSAGLFFADRSTGRPLRTLQPGSGFSTTPAVRGATLWALTNLGTLYRLRMVGEGE